VPELEPRPEPRDAGSGRVLGEDQQDVAPPVCRKPPPGLQIGLPAVARAHLLDRRTHQLALLGATLLALLGCECSSCLAYGLDLRSWPRRGCGAVPTSPQPARAAKLGGNRPAPELCVTVDSLACASVLLAADAFEAVFAVVGGESFGVSGGWWRARVLGWWSAFVFA